MKKVCHFSGRILGNLNWHINRMEHPGSIKPLMLSFFLSLLSLGVLAQEIPKGYEKYELEELNFFRKKITFSDPMATQITFPDTANKTGKPASGKDTLITVKYDLGPEIESLLDRHKNMDQNQQEKMVKGFRIQLYAGLDRSASDKMKVDFMALWPDVQVFQTYSRPTFKVRAGNFLTRTEAEMFCQRVKHHFSGAFVVPELIQINRKENPYEAPPSPGER